TKYIEEGGLYKVSAWVKLIEPATTSLQLSTQVGNGSAANYATIKASGITASEGWVLYEGTYRYSNMSSGFASIYVESSSSATASFYIDDVAFEKVGNPITIEDDLTKIKEVYDGTFLIGNAVSAEDLGGVRLELLKNHFNIITPGNAGKPDALQPSKGNFTFTTTDALFQTAIDNGFLIHGHTLAWHQQSPTWLNRDADGKPLPREEALENLKTHAFTVVKHFSETFNAEEQNIISWDVVNEAMGDSIANSSDWKGSLRNTPWLEAVGWEYIEEAFLSAREADPNVKLYYNDYNLNGIAKATAVYEMIKDINTRYPDVGGRPLIDGVGMQGHYRLGVNPSGVENSIELFESLGIEISITELDIQAGSNSFLSEENEEAQAVLYAQLFQVFKNHSDSIARVTFWGLDDGASWRAETNPLLFDRDLQSKLAFDAVIDPDKFLEDYAAGSLDGKKIEANYGTPEIDGEEDEIWADAKVIDIDKFQLAWQGAKGKGKLLWDDLYLYALVTVSDTELDKASANAYEQDSVEVFVDENNAKSSSYEADDGQYRVNFDNETSFDHGLSEGFESATKIDGTTYTVELKIPWKTITPENDFEVGVDISINDARNGFRQSVSAWSDSFGTAYADPSVFGTATLVGKPEEQEEPTPAASTPAVSQPSTSIPSVGIKVGELDDPATGDKVYASLGVTVGADKVGTVVIYDYVADALIQKAATLPVGEPRVYAIEVKTGNSEGVKVRIPWASLNSFATSYKDASFAVYSDKWEVRFDNKALFAILGSSTGLIDITVKKIEAPNALSGRPAYDFSVSKNSVYISDFLGGRAFTRIPYALGAGEDPNALVVYWIDGNRITPVRSVWRGSYLSFSSYHFSSFGIGYNPVSYTDVSDSAYYAKAASYLGARGVFEGPLFEPGKAATRGEAIVTLLKAYGIEPLGASAPNFKDATGEYAGYYAKAKAIGLSVGIGNNLLAPDMVLNRETLFALVYNLLDILEELPEAKAIKSVSVFNDASSFSDWAKAPVGKLVDAGILAGTGNGEFRPLDSSNRAQLANAIYRLELGETAE
ncbi:MAG: endo-1,4-beta-xylanase, partial [Clostridiales bacterium]|nr:endo-1,4-beta-xylanase [Clostridiales bacterium]